MGTKMEKQSKEWETVNCAPDKELIFKLYEEQKQLNNKDPTKNEQIF